MPPDDLWWDEARPCPDCTTDWTPTNPMQKRCPDCQRDVYRQRNRENMRRVRAQKDDMSETKMIAALSYDEAAAYLGVGRSWLEHSDVPRVKLGRRVVFRIVDLDSYLQQRVA